MAGKQHKADNWLERIWRQTRIVGTAKRQHRRRTRR
jgi:hypothetical protein